ncbi:MAG: hypothetical protein IKC65_07465 [Lentisphaeria bacterium]|nr:hypothetical protein [Lentisphaeria bacterium]
MKNLLLLLMLAVCTIALSAAEQTQIAIFNYGKRAVLKPGSGNFTAKFTQSKDPKTGMVKYKCLYFTISEKNSDRKDGDKKIDYSFEAGNGNLVVYVGYNKASIFSWTKFVIDGKEQLQNPKGEIFQVRKFTVGNLTKPKKITLSAIYKIPTKKEINAEKKNQKESRKRAKKTQAK